MRRQNLPSRYDKKYEPGSLFGSAVITEIVFSYSQLCVVTSPKKQQLSVISKNVLETLSHHYVLVQSMLCRCKDCR